MSEPRDSFALEPNGGKRREVTPPRALRVLGSGGESGHLTSEPPPQSRPSPPGLVSTVSAGPAVIECWLVEDAGGGRLAKRPAALLLRQGPGGPPPRPDLDPELYLKVHGESSRTRLQLSLPPKPPL